MSGVEARDHILPCMTQHAVVRMQQRGIPPFVVECLLDHGKVQHDHHGGRILFFDKAAWRRATKNALAKARVELEKYRRSYVVLGSDGAVLTLGHRYKRIRRH